MITGRVLSAGNPPITGRPILEITIANPHRPRRTRTLQVTVDTGFNGYLTLTPDIIEELGLPERGKNQAELADGSMIEVKSYPVMIQWQEGNKIAPAIPSNSEPLLGMATLWGNRLTMDAQDNGEVRIGGMKEKKT